MTDLNKIYLIIVIITFSCNDQRKEPGNGNMGIAKTKLDLVKSKAQTLYDQDRYAEAIIYFDSLINIDSTQGQYYFQRAFSYGMLIQRDKAIEDFKRSIAHNYKVNHSYYNIGINYEYDNDSLALINFEKCLKTDPGYTKAAVGILECKKRLGKWKLYPREKIPDRFRNKSFPTSP